MANLWGTRRLTWSCRGYHGLNGGLLSSCCFSFFFSFLLGADTWPASTKVPTRKLDHLWKPILARHRPLLLRRTPSMRTSRVVNSRYRWFPGMTCIEFSSSVLAAVDQVALARMV